jgi:hypothetical protein
MFFKNVFDFSEVGASGWEQNPGIIGKKPGV